VAAELPLGGGTEQKLGPDSPARVTEYARRISPVADAERKLGATLCNL
jgi:hypothetical protein